MATSVPLYLPRTTSPSSGPRPICRPNSKSDMGISSKSAPSTRARRARLEGAEDVEDQRQRRRPDRKDRASLSTSVCVAALGVTNGSTYVDADAGPLSATA